MVNTTEVMVNVVISMQNTSPPLWNTDCFWIASWNTWAGNQSSVAFSGFADCSATFLQRDVFTLISVLKDKMRFYISWSAWKASNFFFFLPPDIEKLCTFSQRFPLPSMYRALVWKVLLGMIPKSWELLSSKMSNWWGHWYLISQKNDFFRMLTGH